MFRNICRTITTNTPWMMRAYENKDALRIKEIALPVIHDLVSAPPSLTTKQRNELYQYHVQRGLETASTQVISKEDQVVGFVTYHLSDKYLVRPTGVIEHLAIDPVYRKQGLGKALLDRAVKDLDEQAVRTISLRITEPDIASFYEKEGFHIAKHPDLRWGNAGSMIKILRPSPLPILGPIVDRFSHHEKGSLVKKVLLQIGLLSALILLDKNEKKKAAHPKT